MIVYGRNVAKEYLKNPKKIEKIILQDGFDDKSILSLMENSDLNIKYMSKREIDNLSDGVHQGIMLYVSDYKYALLDDVLKTDPKFIVILDHIEDPHNFGAIIRTCEALGIDGIIIPNDRSVTINGTVVKTSVGAIYNMPIIKVVNLGNTIEKLKDIGYWIVGTDMIGTDYTEIDYNMPICLVIGNEGKGISKLIKDNCDFMATIPMSGNINSLNASVSCGIVLSRIVASRK